MAKLPSQSQPDKMRKILKLQSKKLFPMLGTYRKILLLNISNKFSLSQSQKMISMKENRSYSIPVPKEVNGVEVSEARKLKEWLATKDQENVISDI